MGKSAVETGGLQMKGISPFLLSLGPHAIEERRSFLLVTDFLSRLAHVHFHAANVPEELLATRGGAVHVIVLVAHRGRPRGPIIRRSHGGCRFSSLRHAQWRGREAEAAAVLGYALSEGEGVRLIVGYDGDGSPGKPESGAHVGEEVYPQKVLALKSRRGRSRCSCAAAASTAAAAAAATNAAAAAAAATAATTAASSTGSLRLGCWLAPGARVSK